MVSAEINLSGAERAALLLMALGEQEAAEVLKYMEPKEVDILGTTMSNMTDVTQDKIKHVLSQFIENVGNESSLSIGSNDYLKTILNKALGQDKARNVMSRIASENSGRHDNSLENLHWMAPRDIAHLIGDEHPQIIAIVMVHLEEDQAGEVLKLLPAEIRTAVVMRIASMDGVHPSALAELNDILQKRLREDKVETKLPGIGGVKTAASILNALDASENDVVVKEMDDIDADLSAKIQDNMFIFENLLDLDDRGAQTLLREVSSDELVVALKGATTAMQEKIFKNMSKRAGEMLRDDLDAKGPMRLTDVEAAQKSIIEVARRLEQDGKIMISKGGDDFV